MGKIVAPKTVGELRKILEQYPENLEIWVQGDTTEHPNAYPEHFVVEYYPFPQSEPAMLLLAGLPVSVEPSGDIEDWDNTTGHN